MGYAKRDTFRQRVVFTKGKIIFFLIKKLKKKEKVNYWPRVKEKSNSNNKNNYWINRKLRMKIIYKK